MKYKTQKKLNPRDPATPKKYYAVPVYDGTVEFDEIVNRISRTCTLTPADVTAVLRALSDELPHYLMEGRSVNLENLGRFRLSFSSDGQEKENDVSASDIKNVKIIFRPAPKFLQEAKKTKFYKQI